jgi:hypothetical protein
LKVIAKSLWTLETIAVVPDTSEVAGNSVLLYYRPRNEDSGESQKWGSFSSVISRVFDIFARQARM